MRFSQSTHLLKIFFGDFSAHHKDWLTCSGGTDRPGYLRRTYSYVNFPTQIPDCNSHSPTTLDLFISSDTSICSTMAFPPFGNSDHVAVSVSIDFHYGMPKFIA